METPVNPVEAAAKIGDLSEALLDPVSDEIDLAILVEMVDVLDTANRNIRSAVGQAKTLANRLIDKAGEQRATASSRSAPAPGDAPTSTATASSSM